MLLGMVNRVSIYENRSLHELGWNSRDPIAFMGKNEETYLSIPDRLARDGSWGYGLEFMFKFKDNAEKWVLYPQGNVMLLKTPKWEYGADTALVPDVAYLNPCGGGKNGAIPEIENACFGKEEIMKMFRRSSNMQYYEYAILNDKLILGRTDLGDIISHMGLDILLPNPVRFKGY